MRVKITYAYDGTSFYGSQKQAKERTVDSVFEDVLFGINNKKETKFVASGRTDKAVHALAQTAHFDLSIDITMPKLKRALNSYLDEDIHVISCEKVDDGFHARFNAKEKTYVYKLNMGDYDVCKRNYVYQYNKELDVEKMKEAAKCFLGEHDFKNFVSAQDKRDNYKRKITNLSISQDTKILSFYISANGFMKYQVRKMIAVLIKVGQSKMDLYAVKSLLEKENLNNAHIANPEGLYLLEVKY